MRKTDKVIREHGQRPNEIDFFALLNFVFAVNPFYVSILVCFYVLRNQGWPTDGQSVLAKKMEVW